jgi:hypothetical protein
LEPHFAVLNPGGRDKTQLFVHGAGRPSDPGHPPVNYHAYAACCGGGFYGDRKDVPEGVRSVLVLLRKNGLPQAGEAIRKLRAAGKKVFVSWKESGFHQVGEALGDARRYARFLAICAEADGFLASTPELSVLYRAAGCRAGEFVPTPYPAGESGWEFSRPMDERVGIFVGTREFFVPSRNHLLAVTCACLMGVPVTVINTDGSAGERLLRAISPEIRIVNTKLSYPEYLQLMARHRLVFQFDRSAVPGQVAGDALLCGVPCVGGDGAIERLIFPDLCGQGRESGELVRIAGALLGDETFYQQMVVASFEKAKTTISFPVVREKLLSL